MERYCELANKKRLNNSAKYQLRTTPIVLMDANDGIGLELRAGRYRPVETQCIAAAGSRREHTAGKRLREIMEKHTHAGHVSRNGRPDVVWQ